MNSYDLIKALKRQFEFSQRVFGAGPKTEQILRHISRQSVDTIARGNPTEEWVDIMILAMDGALRSGSTPYEIAGLLEYKMTVNEAREWPKLEDQVMDEPVHHIKKQVAVTNMTDEQATMINDCIARRNKLTDWEIGLMVSLQKIAYKITSAQASQLNKIWEKATAEG